MSFEAQNNGPWEVSINMLPDNVPAFIQLRDGLAHTPQGAVAVFVAACLIYVNNPALGEQCLVIACDKSLLSKTASGGYQGFGFGASNGFLIKQLDAKKHVPYSYIKGTSPAAGYASTLPFVIETRTNPSSGNESDGRIKLFVHCTGADSPRPITLQKNEKGMWKALEFSSLVVGVRAPQQESKGALEGDF